METFKDHILEAAGNESIEAIAIGDMGWGDYNSEGKPENALVRGKAIPWEVAEPYLDYEYDYGYGAPDCHAITAWTPTRVIFVSQYDGSTSLESVPRNPVDHMPVMPGG